MTVNQAETLTLLPSWLNYTYINLSVKLDFRPRTRWQARKQAGQHMYNSNFPPPQYAANSAEKEGNNESLSLIQKQRGASKCKQSNSDWIERRRQAIKRSGKKQDGRVHRLLAENRHQPGEPVQGELIHKDIQTVKCTRWSSHTLGVLQHTRHQVVSSTSLHFICM